MPARAIALALLSLLLVAPEAAADWTRLHSDNFVYIGDAPEARIRGIAHQVEKFREVMLRVLPPGRPVSMPSTVVIVFRTRQSFYPYLPKRGGLAYEVSGYFSPASDVNYMALNGDLGDIAFEAVFHGYASVLLRNAIGPMPLWLSQGLSSIYDTFEERDGGKGALIGRPRKEDIDRLRTGTFVPLEQLVAVDSASDVMRDSRRFMFDAESWAFTHYLMMGSEVRATQFRGYLAALSEGVAADRAFSDAFGDLTRLEQEVQAYTRNFAFLATRFTFDEKITVSTVQKGEKLPDQESQSYLADFLARIGRVDDARALLNRVVAEKPETARAHAVLGEIDARANNLDDAIAGLQRAVMLAPGDVQYQRALGRILYQQLQKRTGDDADTKALRERTRVVLSSVWEQEQTNGEAAGTLGYLELVSGNAARAVTLLTRAAALAPKREQFRLLLAAALMRTRDLDGATRQLGVLMARGSTADIRDQARTMLTQVAAQRNSVAPQPAPIPSLPTEFTGALPATPDTAATNAPEPPSPPVVGGQPAAAERVSGQRVRPSFRNVLAGEVRVQGIFEAVDCGQNRVVLRVRTDSGVLKFAAGQMTDVDFISYRSTAPSAINCGTQTPLPVFATYKALPPGSLRDVDGQAVAIELLPADAQQP